MSYETDYLIGLTRDRTKTTGAIGSLAAAWRTAAARAAGHLHSLSR